MYEDNGENSFLLPEDNPMLTELLAQKKIDQLSVLLEKVIPDGLSDSKGDIKG